MSWYAVDSVDDAIDATRLFLFPVEPVTWLKLALIAIFVGVGGGGVSSVSNVVNLPANMPADAPQPGAAPAPAEPAPELLPTDPVVLGGIVGIVVLIGLTLAFLSQTLQLVMYDALRTQTVRLREPFRRRFGQAARLWGFKLLVNLAFLIPLAVIGGAVLLSGDVGGGTALIVGGLAAAVVLGLSFVASAVIGRATDEFVAPVMVLTDSGVLDGWRRVWPVLQENLAQFGVYIIVHFLLLLAVSVGQTVLGLLVFGIVGTLGAVVGLLLVVGVFGGLQAALASTAGAVAVGILVLLTLLVAAVLYLPIKIVVLTYVLSYEVSVLGAADEELQLLPTSFSNDTEATTPSTG